MKFFCNNTGTCYREKPEGHCWDCSHANFCGKISVRGKKLWRFQFNPYAGFTFINADGETSKIVPVEKNPVWKKLSTFVRKIQKNNLKDKKEKVKG